MRHAYVRKCPNLITMYTFIVDQKHKRNLPTSSDGYDTLNMPCSRYYRVEYRLYINNERILY